MYAEKKENSDKSQAAFIERWTKELENASNKEKDWREEAKKYFQIYKDEKKIITESRESSSRYNVFWSNTQTLRPLVFSNLPNPNITRRFLDKDDNARILSEMMERSIRYFLDETDAENIFNKQRDDFLIGGRGLVRVVYDPEEVVEIREKTINPETEEEIETIEEDIDPSTKKVRLEYVDWKDLLISPENVWSDVRWIAFRHKFTRKQLVDNFGKLGEEVNLDYSCLDSLDKETEYSLINDDAFKYAEVWEVWDKEEKRIIFLTTGSGGKILRDEEDNYNLKNFFPIPKLLGSDSNPCGLTPIPLYRMYKGQAEELNEVDARIKSLVQQCKFTGVYSSLSESADMENLLNGEDGQFSPLSGVQPGSDIKSSIYTKPITDIVTTIAQLNQQKSLILQNIRDITGISDIVRGTTLASETATAQRLKGDFAISRIQPLQKEMEISVKNIIELMAELIVENYSIEELAKITGLKIVDIEAIAQITNEKQQALFDEAVSQINPSSPEGQQQIQELEAQRKAGFEKTMKKPLNDLKGYAVTPQQLEEIERLMTDDKLRSFSINIETDSTIKVDQDQQKQERIEYVNAISGFSSNFFPLVQAGIVSPEAFNAFLGFISRPFKVGRNLEEYLLSVDEEPQQNEGPSIEEQLSMAESQRKDQELQLKQQELQIKADQEQQKIDIEKAKVKLSQIQFDDKLEFEDVNKEADRRAKTLDQLVKARTERVNQQIRESNLV